MNPPSHVTLILGGAAAVLLICAVVYACVRRWRRKTPEEIEHLRRLDVSRLGRITPAHIVDFIEPETAPPAQLVVYKYELAGVTYEAAQDVTSLPGMFDRARHAADQEVCVKYDPRVPTNSILVCEDWCGIPDVGPRPAPERQAVEPVSD